MEQASFWGLKDFCSNFPKLARKMFEPLLCQNFSWGCISDDPQTRSMRFWVTFCSDFHQIKTFGGAMAPLSPTPPTGCVSDSSASVGNNVICGGPLSSVCRNFWGGAASQKSGLLTGTTQAASIESVRLRKPLQGVSRGPLAQGPIGSNRLLAGPDHFNDRLSLPDWFGWAKR